MKILIDDVDPPNLFQLYDSLLKVNIGNSDKICIFQIDILEDVDTSNLFQLYDSLFISFTPNEITTEE